MEQVTSTSSYALVPVATTAGTPQPTRNRSRKSGLARVASERYLQVQNTGGWARSRTTSGALRSSSSQTFAGSNEDRVSLSSLHQTTIEQLAAQAYSKAHRAVSGGLQQVSGHPQIQAAGGIAESPETRRAVRNAYGSAALHLARTVSPPGSLLSVFA